MEPTVKWKETVLKETTWDHNQHSEEKAQTVMESEGPQDGRAPLGRAQTQTDQGGGRRMVAGERQGLGRDFKGRLASSR